jgi:hypothetical protein
MSMGSSEHGQKHEQISSLWPSMAPVNQNGFLVFSWLKRFFSILDLFGVLGGQLAMVGALLSQLPNSHTCKSKLTIKQHLAGQAQVEHARGCLAICVVEWRSTARSKLQ